MIKGGALKDLREMLADNPFKSNNERDDLIQALEPMKALRMLCEWNLGDPEWADTFVRWAKEVGLRVE